MNNKSQHSIKELTPELMRDYTQNKLSKEERYAVEKFLLDNPFEAEAMEGFEMAPNDFNSDVEELKQKLNQKLTRNDQKIIPLYRRYYTIAAAIALIIAGSWFTISLFQEKNIPESTIALESESLASDSIDQENPNFTDKEKIEEKSVSDKNIPDDKEYQPSEEINEQEIAGSEQVESEDSSDQEKFESIIMEETVGDDLNNTEVIAESDLEEETVVEEYVLDEAEPEPESIIAYDQKPDAENEGLTESRNQGLIQPNKTSSTRKKGRASAYSIIQEKENRSVQGTVYSAEDGAPLPGVNVLVKGSSKGSITDINGQFDIEADSDDVLQVSFVGMETEELSISDSSILNIEMSPDIAELSEIVITTNDLTEENSSFESARPTIGFKEYREYLKNSLVYPEEARANNITGKVVVEFTVGTDGRPKDITVIRALGYNCDEEAVRLIEEGPNWKPATQNSRTVEQKVRIKVRFESN